MSLKNTVRFALLLSLILAAFWHMSRTYSPHTVLYELGGTVEHTDVDKIFRDFPNATLNWEMRTPDYTLIMTTGNDQLHQKRTAQKGIYANLFGQELTLSRAVADKLFKTDVANHQSLQILGRPYLLAQVIQEGNYAYIPYDETLLGEKWERTRLYYTVDAIETVELVDERLGNLIALLDLKIYNKTFQKNVVYLFYNLALGLCLYMLFHFLMKTKALIERHYQALADIRKTYLPFYGLKTFVLAEKARIGSLIGLGVFAVLQVLVGLGMLRNFMLPRFLIPSNWFSLSSYLDIGRQLAAYLSDLLQYGLPPVLQTGFTWCAGLMLYLFLIDRRFMKRKASLVEASRQFSRELDREGNALS